ncbi:MAG: hypothetical protein U0574_10690 [Phycisphaerales bacterium]
MDARVRLALVDCLSGDDRVREKQVQVPIVERLPQRLGASSEAPDRNTLIRWSQASILWRRSGDSTSGLEAPMQRHALFGVILAAFLLAPLARAEDSIPACQPAWFPSFGPNPGVSGPLLPKVYAVAVFDDGTGPALYAGGYFTAAGAVPASNIAKWDGGKWLALGSGVLGSGVPGIVQALAVFDDGSGAGPSLYAGGIFASAGGVPAANLAKWNGTSWSAVGGGTNGQVTSLLACGSGGTVAPGLYVGGEFTSAGGVTVNRIARWSGTAWSALGSGTNERVLALQMFDDGSGAGARLYAGGLFTAAGGAPANRIAMWSGSAWSPLGSGISGGNPSVNSLGVYDDGSGDGPALIVGGGFNFAGDVFRPRIAKWNGMAWSGVGPGMSDGTVTSLVVFDDGSGTKLYAGGSFTGAVGVPANRVARWNGSTWAALGAGVDDAVFAMVAYNDGQAATALYVGGDFKYADGIGAEGVARWGSGSWSCLGSGPNDLIRAIAVFDDGLGGGPALFVGGDFTSIGGVAINRIARWNGSAWSAVGSGVDSTVRSLTVFDDGLGGGPHLYVGGWFTHAGGLATGPIARWNGSSWSSLGAGTNGAVDALCASRDASGPVLYVGGEFNEAGGASAMRIAKWNGLSWAPLGSGTDQSVYALAAFPASSGAIPTLYAGGNFAIAGGVAANHVAKWNGVAWSAMSSGLGGGSAAVFGLTAYDDGSGNGPVLYAGGNFFMAGATVVNNVARWNGSAWLPLGSGVNGPVQALTGFTDGSGDGPSLFITGGFMTAGGAPALRIAKWHASSWSALGGGVNSGGYALTRVDSSGGSTALVLGGSFTSSPSGDSYLATWGGCPLPALGDLNGDGLVDGADLALLLGSWGSCSSCPADLNGDGVVDGDDITLLFKHWGAMDAGWRPSEMGLSVE